MIFILKKNSYFLVDVYVKDGKILNDIKFPFCPSNDLKVRMTDKYMYSDEYIVVKSKKSFLNYLSS